MKYEFETEVFFTNEIMTGMTEFRKDFSKLNKIRKYLGLYLADAKIRLPKNIKEKLHENDKVKITVEIKNGENK